MVIACMDAMTHRGDAGLKPQSILLYAIRGVLHYHSQRFLERGWGNKTFLSRNFLQPEGWEEKFHPLVPWEASQYALKCHPYLAGLQKVWLWKINPDQKSFRTSCFDNLLQTGIPQVEQKAFAEAFFLLLFFVFTSVSTHQVSCSHMVMQNKKTCT